MTGTVRVGIDIRTKEQRAAHVRNLCPFVLLSYPIIRFVILSECQIRTRENRVYGGRARKLMTGQRWHIIDFHTTASLWPSSLNRERPR